MAFDNKTNFINFFSKKKKKKSYAVYSTVITPKLMIQCKKFAVLPILQANRWGGGEGGGTCISGWILSL